MDITTLQAALLHDTVEDTHVTLEDDRGGVRRRGRAHRRRPHEAGPDRVPLPRAGAGRERPQDDRRDGRRHPGPADQARRPPAQHADARRVPRQKQRRIATETLEIYAPLAHRLGVQELKWELEDLSFKALHPRAAIEEIASLVEKRRGERQRADRTGHRPSRAPSSRSSGSRPRSRADPKHLYSIYEKMVLRGKEFNEIYDLVGVRVLVDSLARLLRGPRRDPLAVEARPRPVQGLHRDAQVQHVPVAAHHGGRVRAASRWRSRSEPARCTARPSSASRRTGATRRAASRRRTPPTWPGSAR